DLNSARRPAPLAGEKGAFIPVEIIPEQRAERNVLRIIAGSACVEKPDVDVVDPDLDGNGFAAREEYLGPVLDIEIRLERHADEDGFAIDPYRARVSGHVIGDPGPMPAAKEGFRSL